MSHFYDLAGNSQHEVIGKTTGRPRPTTIKDARAAGWLPSVTTVLDILSKPQLDTWKQDQVALALRRMLKEGKALPPEDRPFCSAVRSEAFKQVSDAADLGTRIHAAIEAWFNGKDYDPDLEKYISPIEPLLRKHGIRLTDHELRLVSKEYGYAGTTDAAYTMDHDPALVGIIDFKSRKSDPKYPMDPWDGQATQIAAYWAAKWPHFDIKLAVGANVFISTTEPGRVEIVFYTGEQLAQELELFRHLLRVWQIRQSYVPPRT